MSTTDREPATWLSQDAYDRLQAELNELIAARPVIAAEINARREEGDLRENGGYHAAREEQGKAGGAASATCRSCCVPPRSARRRRRTRWPRAPWSRSTSTTTPTTPRRSCSARGRSRRPPT